MFYDEGHSFDRALFYGNEYALFSFTVLLWGIVDYGQKNSITTFIVVVIVYETITALRGYYGKKNLARQGFIDTRFLI